MPSYLSNTKFMKPNSFLYKVYATRMYKYPGGYLATQSGDVFGGGARLGNVCSLTQDVPPPPIPQPKPPEKNTYNHAPPCVKCENCY